MLVEEIDHDRALDLHVRKISQILPVHRRSSTDIDTTIVFRERRKRTS
jgi:hypothetical protein